MRVDELHAYLFEGQAHPLAGPMSTWLDSSRRFLSFTTTFRDKIRKKLRTTQDRETLQDLRLELETAYLLSREPRLSLVYEPRCEQERCPDFVVSFTTSLTFTVEVTRLRVVQVSSFLSNSLADTICSKLGQLLPQQSNVLIIGMDTPPPAAKDIQAVMLRLQQRAERNDPALLQRCRFRDRAGFFRQYQRLSEILARGSNGPSIAWVNPQAKFPLPGKVRTVLHRSQTP